jgi:hypothetical protein
MTETAQKNLTKCVHLYASKYPPKYILEDKENRDWLTKLYKCIDTDIKKR